MHTPLPLRERSRSQIGQWPDVLGKSKPGVGSVPLREQQRGKCRLRLVSQIADSVRSLSELYSKE